MASTAYAFAEVSTVHGSQATAIVESSDPTVDYPTLDIESADDAYAVAIARTVAQQSGFEIRVGGTVVDLAKFTGDISVTRSYDDVRQTWNWTLTLDDATGHLGSPFSCVGPPTGRREVDIYGCYKLPNGSVLKVPLILGGVADNSSREASGDGTFTETLTGVDRGGQFDQQPVTLVLPPGHGFPRGRVVKLLATRAGEDQFRLEDGNRMLKELQVVDGDWLGISQELMEVENRRLLWDHEGYLWNPKIGIPRSGEQNVFDFDQRDFLSLAPVTISHKADLLTDVTLTGTEQVEDDGLCAEEPQTRVVESSEEDHVLFTPAYIYNGSTFSANPANPSTPADRVVKRIVYTQTLKCGVTVYERTETFGYKNPIAARQQYTTGTGWEMIANVFTDDNDQTSGELAYQFDEEKWGLIGLVEAWHYYFQLGFVRGFTPGEHEGLAWLRGAYTALLDPDTGYYVGGHANQYIGSVTRTWAHTFPRKRVKERDTSVIEPWDAWDDIEPENGVRRIGQDGQDDSPTLPFNSAHASGSVGSISNGEALIPVSEQIINVIADDAGYKEREVVYERSWSHAPTGTGPYLFGDGSESLEAVDTFQDSSETETIYVKGEEGLHKVVVSRKEFGQLVSGESRDGEAGWPPAVPTIDAYEWLPDEYESDEDFQEFKGYAKRSNTRQIKVQVLAPGLLTCHFDNILKTEIQWAENESELEAIARFLIDESGAAEVQATILAYFFLRECQTGYLRYARIGLDHRVRIRSVTHSGPPEGPVTTQLNARLYGWEES